MSVLAVAGGLATVWLLATPSARQAAAQAGTSTTSAEAGTSAVRTTTVRLAWDPNAEQDLAGYVVSWGDTSGQYTQSKAVGAKETTVDIEVALRAQPYFIVVQGRNTAGQLGGYSNEFRLDVSSGRARPLKAPAASSAAAAKKAGAKPKLSKEEKAQLRREKKERQKKAQGAAGEKQP